MDQASWPKSSRKGIGVYTPTVVQLVDKAKIQMEVKPMQMWMVFMKMK